MLEPRAGRGGGSVATGRTVVARFQDFRRGHTLTDLSLLSGPVPLVVAATGAAGGVWF